MSLDRLKVTSYVNAASLFACVIGLILHSFNTTIVSLLVFCLSGNILAMLNFQKTVMNMHKELARLKVVSDLLRNGVFDPVLDIPDEVLK